MGARARAIYEFCVRRISAVFTATMLDRAFVANQPVCDLEKNISLNISGSEVTLRQHGVVTRVTVLGARARTHTV